MNVNEAADFLGVSVPFVYKWVDKIPHRKLGDRILFGRVALIKWLDGKGRYDVLAGNDGEKHEANWKRRPRKKNEGGESE